MASARVRVRVDVGERREDRRALVARRGGSVRQGGRAARGVRGRARRRPQGVEDAPGAHRPDAVEQQQHAEPADLVRWVAADAKGRDEVLDVRGVEESQAAVLHERDVAPGELELEQVSVVAGSEQHGLLLELHPLLARREHALAHRVGLRDFVSRLDELGPRAAVAIGPQRLLCAARSCAATAFATARIGPLER